MVQKKAVKKAVKAKPVSKNLSVKDAFSKSELIKTMVEMTGLAKKQITASMDALNQIIAAHICKKGPGLFVFPGIAKFRVIHKPATKARKGKNPFTGEDMTFAAKPARNVVKVKPLKKLKDLAK